MRRFEGVRPQSYIQDILGPGGLLERKLPGYKSRPEQIALADAFAGHLLCGNILYPDAPMFLAEAPCGTGKTFAYLVPAVYTTANSNNGDLRLWLSTASISLQTQLVKKDLPLLLEIMKPYLNFKHLEVNLWKGASNYTCKRRVMQEDCLEALGPDQKLTPEEREYMDMLQMYFYGEDLDERPPPTRRLLPVVAASSDTCVGHSCAYWSVCKYAAAKMRARKAGTLTVLNHHLLSVMTVRESFIFPDLILVDEAHEFLPIKRQILTRKWTQKKWETYIKTLFRDACKKTLKPDDLERIQKLYEHAMNHEMFPPSIKEAVLAAKNNVIVVHDMGTKVGGHSLIELSMRADSISSHLRGLVGEREEWEIHEGIRLHPSAQEKACFTLDPETGELALTRVPMYLHLDKITACFSATLRVDGSFDTFLSQTSSEKAVTFTTPSPFRWEEQALVIFPTNEGVDPTLPRDQYDRKMAVSVRKILEAAEGRGGILFLCSSWATANLTAAVLRKHAKSKVILQGEQGREDTISQFKVDCDSILVGTLSLWTGLDVPGDALSVLVIDKLPFRGGVDPFVEVQKTVDKDWFHRHSLAPASLLMAQGFGRLIRSVNDRGVCIVLDTRIFPQNPKKKPYWKKVINTVFPEGVNISDQLDDLARFFDE